MPFKDFTEITSGNFPNLQFPKKELAKYVPAAAFGRSKPIQAAGLSPHCSLWPNLTLNVHLVNVHLESCSFGKKPWEVWPWESTKNLLVFYDFSELEFIKFQRTIFFSLIYCIQCKLYYWNSEKKQY